MAIHAPSLLIALAFGSFALGCGGGPGADEPRAASTEGGELAAASAPRVPSGPTPSFLPAGTKVIGRLDMARVRRSPLGPDISSAIRSTPTWQRLAGGAGLDPVRDFDAIVAGGDALYTDRRVVVLRHPHSEAEVRQRILGLAVDRGASPEWREVEGFSAVTWPMPQTSLTYSLVITAPGELVLAPDDELGRIAEVARDHALRRAAGAGDVLEPYLAGRRPDEIATLVMDVPLPARPGYPEPPQRTRVEIDEAEGDAVLSVRAEFEDGARASAAGRWVDEQRAFYASQMMVRAVGMHRPLEAARVEASGPQLAIDARLSSEEIRRVLGLMALSQLGQSN
jgi:hypothetical protein